MIYSVSVKPMDTNQINTDPNDIMLLQTGCYQELFIQEY